MLADIPQTWDEVWALEPGVYSWVQDMPLEWQPDGTPLGALRVELSVHSSAPDVPSGTRSAMLSYIDGAATRTRYIGERSSVGDHWAKLAIAQPPQEFDLPLADGIIALQPCTYWKNQFEEVTIYGCTYGKVTEGDTIATLPEGFRPDHPVEWPASFTGDAGRVSGTVFISESGIVSIHTTAPAMSVVFAASFLAAG